MFIQAAVIQLTQPTVVTLVVTSTVFVVGLIVLLGLFIWRTENPLQYGSFFVVALGITTALMGFLVAFPLIISGVFTDPTQVLAILSALFGTLVGLVGTYFGVKASSDAREGAQQLARETPTLAATEAAQAAQAATQAAQAATQTAQAATHAAQTGQTGQAAAEAQEEQAEEEQQGTREYREQQRW